MSRRRAEQGFGSDSFLDIIANIVGILIILIVIAGVRVSQTANESEPEPVETAAPVQPEPVPIPQPEPHIAPILKPDPVTNAALADPSLTAKALHHSEPVEPAAPEPPPPPRTPSAIAQPALHTPSIKRPSPYLASNIAAREQEIQTLRQTERDERGSRSLWEQQLQQAVSAAKSQQQELETLTANAANRTALLAELRRSLSRSRQVLIGEQRDLAAAKKQTGPVREIKHRFNPVSRVVEGKELHFHLKGNRIAFVPLEGLIDRMKKQVLRQKDWLIKYNEHNGQVGPLRGFRLDYTVARQRLSALEDARRGGGYARIAPVLLKFVPVEPLAESATQALQPGSEFIRELQIAEADTTLTFWVYPDSFGLYQQLTAFARAEGFTIAARPLPEGELITASPYGTRSAGQ